MTLSAASSSQVQAQAIRAMTIATTAVKTVLLALIACAPAVTTGGDPVVVIPPVPVIESVPVPEGVDGEVRWKPPPPGAEVSLEVPVGSLSPPVSVELC